MSLVSVVFTVEDLAPCVRQTWRARDAKKGQRVFTYLVRAYNGVSYVWFEISCISEYDLLEVLPKNVYSIKLLRSVLVHV